jgi:cation diffusion facilitator CzcD-associated flavoprotein CzcO
MIGSCKTDKELTGASNRKAGHVTTFIREPTWISPTPGMEYRKYTDEERSEFVLHPDKLTKLRKESEKAIGDIFAVVFDGSAAQKQLEAFVKDKMIEKLSNKDLERLLIPDFAFGCRRITVSLKSGL